MLGSLLVKIANGIPLSPTELQEIERAGNTFESISSLVTSYIPPGTGTIKIPLSFDLVSVVTVPQDTNQLDIDTPSGYNHLLLFCAGRVAGTAGGVEVDMCFNDDTGSNYKYGGHYNTGTGVYHSVLNPATMMYIGFWVEGGGAVSDIASTIIFIPNFRSSTLNKSILSIEGSFVSSGLWTGTWESTNPIKKISIKPNTATEVNAKIGASTVVSLYGVV